MHKKLREKYEKYRREKSLDVLSKESLLWFFNYTKKYARTSSFSKVKDSGIRTNKIIPGKFYIYKYDPKLKEKLPYYDTLPLVLITNINEDGWHGINFHYMPPDFRLAIMEIFLKTIQNKNIPEKTKLKINWNLAYELSKKVGSNLYLKHSIKRYLVSHVRSELIEVKPEHWFLVLFLPLSRFKKKSETYIWYDL